MLDHTSSRRRSHMRLTRRSLLERAAMVAALAVIAPPILRVNAQTRFTENPFTLGVASGDPWPTGAVIWTRIAPRPLEPLDESLGDVPVEWEVAEDEGFATIVQSGTAIAPAARAHAVHVEVEGLKPFRPYWYRFRAGGAESPVGRTHTALAPGAAGDQTLNFTFASCGHYEHGTFAGYRAMAAENPHAMLFLGDYIYEVTYGKPEQKIRPLTSAEPTDLAGYRLRYAEYKRDLDLQAAHAAAPWIVTWDDHEVDNDYAADQSEDLHNPAFFLARRAAAYQAFFEAMPLRLSALPDATAMKLYRRIRYGDFLDFWVLDTRQHRSDQACIGAQGGTYNKRGANRRLVPCEELYDPARTMLGAEQETWLSYGLGRASAQWNVIAQSVMFCDVEFGGGARATDFWSGYPAARQRLLDRLAETKAKNPLILTGDVHSFWAWDVARDAVKTDSETIAAELVCSSISSLPWPMTDDFMGALRADNPKLREVRGRVNGYVSCTARAERLEARMHTLSDITQEGAGIAETKSFVMEAGKPGLVAG
ncbi:MAG: alkaline phosphatase [Alphaproteobacteria bacterium]|nr:alkaline phosphatase [Alphaproteobacteria bacterium]